VVSITRRKGIVNLIYPKRTPSLESYKSMALCDVCMASTDAEIIRSYPGLIDRVLMNFLRGF